MSNNWLMIDTTMMIDDDWWKKQHTWPFIAIINNINKTSIVLSCHSCSLFIILSTNKQQQTTNNKQQTTNNTQQTVCQCIQKHQQLHSSTTTCKQNNMTNFITKHPHTVRWIDWCVSKHPQHTTAQKSKPLLCCSTSTTHVHSICPPQFFEPLSCASIPCFLTFTFIHNINTQHIKHQHITQFHAHKHIVSFHNISVVVAS